MIYTDLISSSCTPTHPCALGTPGIIPAIKNFSARILVCQKEKQPPPHPAQSGMFLQEWMPNPKKLRANIWTLPKFKILTRNL